MSTQTPQSDTGQVWRCPECKAPMQRKEGKLGPFWGCSNFPKCRATLNDVDGKPSTEVDSRYRCPKCTRQLVHAPKDKGDYWYCSGYRKGCKLRLKNLDGVPEPAYPCPQCDQVLVQRSGKHGLFWGCQGYPECEASYGDKGNKPDLDLLTAKP